MTTQSLSPWKGRAVVTASHCRKGREVKRIVIGPKEAIEDVNDDYSHYDSYERVINGVRYDFMRHYRVGSNEVLAVEAIQIEPNMYESSHYFEVK